MTSQLIPEKNSIEKTIRKKDDYIHFIFASVNFLVMFVASLGFFNTVAICIALTGISSMLYVIFFYYWKIKNQFFFIFNYGSTICSLIILVDVFFFILPIFVLIYFIYLLTMIRNSGVSSISRKIFIGRHGFFMYLPSDVNQMWHDDAVDIYKPIVHRTPFEEQAKFKKEKKKLYNVRKIKLLTLIFTSCFLIIYTYALMNLWS